MWLSLIPQIHSPGDSPDLSMRHHHFIEENPQFYDGKRIFAIALTMNIKERESKTSHMYSE